MCLRLLNVLSKFVCIYEAPTPPPPPPPIKRSFHFPTLAVFLAVESLQRTCPHLRFLALYIAQETLRKHTLLDTPTFNITRLSTLRYTRFARIYSQYFEPLLPHTSIGRVSLACENEAGGSWGQKVHILHVNV